MMTEHNKSDRLKEALERTLTTGKMERVTPEEGAKAIFNTRYEIRIRAERDPIREETRLIRRMAKEPDAKYDSYADDGEARPE